MKRTLIFGVIYCLLNLTAFAQKIEVEESGNALINSVYETDIDEVVKEWNSLMKKYDGKVESDNKKSVAKTAVIKPMSGGTFDVTATFEEVKKGVVKMSVVFDPVILATSAVPQKSKYIAEGKKLLKDFAIKQSKESIGKILKTEQKLLNKEKNQQEDLVKRKGRLEKEIKECEETIKKNEEEIKKNIEEQKQKTTEIELQNKTVESIDKRLGGLE